MLSDKERLEKAIDPVVGMILFDRSGRILGSNEVFRTITGYTTEEIKSGKLTWRTLTPAEWVAESERQMEKFASTGRIGPYEKEYFLKDRSLGEVSLAAGLVARALSAPKRLPTTPSMSWIGSELGLVGNEVGGSALCGDEGGSRKLLARRPEGGATKPPRALTAAAKHPWRC